MSATSRTKAQRDESHDYYRTPRWAIEAIKPFVPVLHNGGGRYELPLLDPCAGDGAILDAFCTREGIDDPFETDRPLRGFELQSALAVRNRPATFSRAGEFARVVTVRDALSEEPWGHEGNVLMNPPFKLAEAFVRRAISEVFPHGGAVLALLPLSFLAGIEREALHLEYPADVFVLPKRPSFCMTVTCRGTCGYRARLPLDREELHGPVVKRPRECPVCKADVSVSTSDASEYAWFRWQTKASSIVRMLDVVGPLPRPHGHVITLFSTELYAFEVSIAGSRTRAEAGALALKALEELGLGARISERGLAGVSAESLRRLFGAAIERKAAELDKAGLRPEVADVKPTKAKRPPKKKTAPEEVSP